MAKQENTDARRRAVSKYLKESVDEIKIRVPKGEKARYKEYASDHGESLNAFIIRAINETIENNN